MGRCVHEADEKWGGESKGADEKWGGESVTPGENVPEPCIIALESVRSTYPVSSEHLTSIYKTILSMHHP